MTTTVWQNLTDALNASMSVDEMSKKYLNTFLLLYTANNEPLVVQYKGFSDDGYFLFNDENGVRLKLSNNTDLQIINKFPERCLFNHDKLALEFIRHPMRQYKRGICKDNVDIYSPVRRLIDKRSYQWTHKVLKSALFPQYPASCQEAIDKLVNKEVLSIALNECFMLSQNVTSTQKNKQLFYLWFSNKLIGYFLKDTFHIKHSLFKQEVLDNIHLFKPFKLEI